MKNALIIAAAIGLAAAAHGHQKVTVQGKPAKGTTITTHANQSKVKNVNAAPKKHRKKFLGIF